MIHALDHEIAAMGGSTMALETTIARIQRAKSQRPQSQEERRRELLWHQRENKFYETCYTLSRNLCAAIDDISQKLQLQSYYEPEVDPSGNCHLGGCLADLKGALEHVQTELVRAEREYKEFWSQKPAAVWI